MLSATERHAPLRSRYFDLLIPILVIYFVGRNPTLTVTFFQWRIIIMSMDCTFYLIKKEIYQAEIEFDKLIQKKMTDPDNQKVFIYDKRINPGFMESLVDFLKKAYSDDPQDVRKLSVLIERQEVQESLRPFLVSNWRGKDSSLSNVRVKGAFHLELPCMKTDYWPTSGMFAWFINVWAGYPPKALTGFHLITQDILNKLLERYKEFASIKDGDTEAMFAKHFGKDTMAECDMHEYFHITMSTFHETMTTVGWMLRKAEANGLNLFINIH